MYLVTKPQDLLATISGYIWYNTVAETLSIFGPKAPRRRPSVV